MFAWLALRSRGAQEPGGCFTELPVAQLGRRGADAASNVDEMDPGVDDEAP